MRTQELSKAEIQLIQQHWVQSAIDLEKADEEVELIEQIFDYIDASQAYGNVDSRNNLNTYIGVLDDSGSCAQVLVEVISHRRGRERTIKIVNMAFSPAIEALDEIAYDNYHASALVHVVQDFVSRTQAPGSSTKIYARNNRNQEFLNRLHESALEMKSQFDDVGLEIQFEGKRWLAFNTKHK